MQNDRRERTEPTQNARKPPASKQDRKQEEVLREQSKSEIEENPYLDTEGGE
jgi:hypothetical protein